MNSKIAAEHLQRTALVYVRQSTVMQTVDHTESRRRQYELTEYASKMGFAGIETIDEDLGRSASGLVDRPGFQRLVSTVCSGDVGAVFCLEASRLARNGRDWHHLIDLCAVVGTLLIDLEGTYDPRVTNDRLLLGLKGTMSEYELSLLRQRGLAARDSKAKRGELRFGLPPGYCWDELGRVHMDPDLRVREAIQLIFQKFREFGSARQVLLWTREHSIHVPVVRQGVRGAHLDWRLPAYHNILTLLQNPCYAGAYAFGRTGIRIHVEEGRARKTSGHKKPQDRWSVLLHDHHAGYISWEEFQHHQQMLVENAHMKKRASRKSARGGRALLTGILRCGRCGRMLRVQYGMQSGHAHRYLCKGDEMRKGSYKCLGVGGVRVDKVIGEQILEAAAPHAVEAAIEALRRSTEANDDVRRATVHELEEAQYEVDLARRRYDLVDPAKRLVARELEARWEAALERVRRIQQRLDDLDAAAAVVPKADRARLLSLAHAFPKVWNASSSDPRVKQRIVRILVQEVILDIDENANEIALVIHWRGGRHSERRMARRRTGRYPADRRPSPVDVLTKLAGRWPDRELAVTMNRMRCRSENGQTWTTARVRELRERLGLSAFDPSINKSMPTISADETARRLSICIGSVHRLIRENVLPAKQVMPSAPWEIPLAALDTEEVRIGVQRIKQRRPHRMRRRVESATPYLPGCQ